MRHDKGQQSSEKEVLEKLFNVKDNATDVEIQLK